MKKILYVCPSTGVGGAETFIKQTHRHCNKEQFKNYYLLFKTGPLYDALNEAGAQVLLLDEVPRLSHLKSHRKVSKKIREIINQYNIDLVHSMMSYGAIFSSVAAKQMGVPHVWFQHGPVDGMMDRLASVMPHNGLIVNSHYTGAEQRALENPFRFLIPRSFPIEKILLGTDLEKPSPDATNEFRQDLLASNNLTTDTLLIGMLCRIQKWKGVHLLAEAVSELKARGIKDFYCFIWGEAFKENDYVEKLKKQVQKESLPIQFMGPTDQVPLCLSSVDVIVNASVNPEPFGLSIIEGMMMGAVPIVTNKGGASEIVKHGKDGLQFKLGQAPSLAKQLETLIKDRDLCKKISQEAQNSAQIKFRAERAISQLETFHQKIING